MPNAASGSKPIENGNALNINEKCFSIVPLTMIRYEALSDFYAQEPLQIRMRLTKETQFSDYEQVLRIRTWFPNKKASSWCIYAKERDWAHVNNNSEGLIIRNVVWDVNFDLESLKSLKENERQTYLNNWPSLKLKTVFLNFNIVSELINTLQVFDRHLEKGIKLSKRKKTEKMQEWLEFEILRLFDWGQVHTTWSSFKTNIVLEDDILNLDKQLEEYMEVALNDIYEFDLDYSCPPNLWKALIQGNMELFLADISKEK